MSKLLFRSLTGLVKRNGLFHQHFAVQFSMFKLKLERVMRIELTSSAWKAEVLPLNYTRVVVIIFMKSFQEFGAVKRS